MQNPSVLATRGTRETTRFSVLDAKCNAAGAMHRVAWALQNSKAIGQKCKNPGKTRVLLRIVKHQNGEDRIRTTRGIASKTHHLLSRGADSGALIRVFENTGLSRPQIADPDLAFIIDAWPLLGPQPKGQMIAIARAARQEG